MVHLVKAMVFPVVMYGCESWTIKVQCRIQEAWGWCTGMTQRDGMGMEVGGGFMYARGGCMLMYGKTNTIL